MGVETARILRKHIRPDHDHWFTRPVVADWWKDYTESGQLEHPFALPDSRLRASWAGDCARAVALHLAGEEESDPFTVADAWRANVGTLLHTHVQQAIIGAFPGSEAEVKIKIMHQGSGHMDLLVLHPDGTVSSVEVKSINGYGFKKMTLGREPEGVRFKYLVQGALNANGMEPKPDRLVIAVFSLETISPKEAANNGLDSEYQRFSAQWTFSRDEYLAVAREETRRLERIVELTDQSGPLAVPRTMPDPRLPQHRIINPMKGLYKITNDMGHDIGMGQTWQCLYCPFQTACDESGR